MTKSRLKSRRRGGRKSHPGVVGGPRCHLASVMYGGPRDERCALGLATQNTHHTAAATAAAAVGPCVSQCEAHGVKNILLM